MTLFPLKVISIYVSASAAITNTIGCVAETTDTYFSPSGGWEVQESGVSRLCAGGRPRSWLAHRSLLAVAFLAGMEVISLMFAYKGTNPIHYLPT